MFKQQGNNSNCDCKCHKVVTNSSEIGYEFGFIETTYKEETYRDCYTCFKEHATYKELLARNKDRVSRLMNNPSVSNIGAGKLGMHSKSSHKMIELQRNVDVSTITRAIYKNNLLTKKGVYFCCSICGNNVKPALRRVQKHKRTQHSRYENLRCWNHLEPDLADIYMTDRRKP